MSFEEIGLQITGRQIGNMTETNQHYIENGNTVRRLKVTFPDTSPVMLETKALMDKRALESITLERIERVGRAWGKRTVSHDLIMTIELRDYSHQDAAEFISRLMAKHYSKNGELQVNITVERSESCGKTVTIRRRADSEANLFAPQSLGWMLKELVAANLVLQSDVEKVQHLFGLEQVDFRAVSRVKASGGQYGYLEQETAMLAAKQANSFRFSRRGIEPVLTAVQRVQENGRGEDALTAEALAARAAAVVPEFPGS